MGIIPEIDIFSKKKNKHIDGQQAQKKCSAWLITTEIQITTTVR